MFEPIRFIGEAVLRKIARLGQASLFISQVVASLPMLLRRFSLVVTQLYEVGVLSIAIIVISALAVGMVLGLQMFYTLRDFGSEQILGQVVALSLVRELGPVLAGLLFAGRAGSALTAEIGLMKATEQLSSMEMMAVDPIKRVVAPRFLAGVLSMPLLAAMFSSVGIIGGYLVGVGLLGVDSGAFWSLMQANVDFYDDILNGIIKSFVFGIIITWIAVFEGYDAKPTAEGVSRATMRTVVHSAFAVLAFDFILTALMFGGN